MEAFRNTKVRTVLVLLAVAVLVLLILRQFIETNSDRAAMNNRVNRLRQQLEQDPHDVESLDELIEILDSNWPFAQVQATVALRRLGDKARPALDALIRALDCGDHAVEREAAIALGEVGRGTDKAIAPLILKLDSDWDVAEFSARSLGKIGAPYAAPAIPKLKQKVATGRPSLAKEAQNAVQAITDSH